MCNTKLRAGDVTKQGIEAGGAHASNPAKRGAADVKSLREINGVPAAFFRHTLW
jgi:hypothetical protein